MREKNIKRHAGQKSKVPILRKQDIIQSKIKNNKSKGEIKKMAEKPKDAAQENIGKLQMLEQQVQTIAMQKQQFQSQLFEVENALKELKTSKTAYKIVGNIMILSDKEKLEKDLKQKKEIIDLRIANLDKEEKKLKEKAKKLQEDLLSTLKKK